MKFPAILVEIPHQMPPRAYVVESLSQLDRFAADSDAEYHVGAPADVDRGLEAIRHDLHWLSCEACGERPAELLSRPPFRTQPRRYLCPACEARQ